MGCIVHHYLLIYGKEQPAHSVQLQSSEIERESGKLGVKTWIFQRLNGRRRLGFGKRIKMNWLTDWLAKSNQIDMVFVFNCNSPVQVARNSS